MNTNTDQNMDKKRRGPWLPQVEDLSGGKMIKKVTFLRRKWGTTGRPLSIADAIRRAVDMAYSSESNDNA